MGITEVTSADGFRIPVTEQGRGRLPENRILSHDLLEGCYAHSGLLSDVELYEEYPPRYEADVSRRHRWIHRLRDCVRRQCCVLGRLVLGQFRYRSRSNLARESLGATHREHHVLSERGSGHSHPDLPLEQHLQRVLAGLSP